MSLELINKQIQDYDTNLISDGYHTFGELYEHRYALFIALCQMYLKEEYDYTDEIKSVNVWKAKNNADGTHWDGWFILGLHPDEGEQITYHLPMKYWDQIDCATYEDNPFYDGHTSADVLKRLQDDNTRTSS